MKLRRCSRWLAVGGACWAVIAFGHQRVAAAAPLYDGLYTGLTVAPATLTTPGETFVIAGPGFPGGTGCRSGTILAVPPGKPLAEASVIVLSVNLDDPFSLPLKSFNGLSFSEGTFDVVLRCGDDAGTTQTRSTEATITVTLAATATTTTQSTSSTTSTTEPGASVDSLGDGRGTVEPASAKPGVTELTIRGGGFAADKELKISLKTAPELALATTRSSAAGTYAALLTLPVAAPPGLQRLVVTGPAATDGNHTTVTDVTVQKLTCADFATPAAAQAALGPAGADPHDLDADHDGFACATVAASSAGSTARAAGSSASSGGLAQTGNRFTPVEVMAGLSVLTLGALLVGLSQPVAPTLRGDFTVPVGRGSGRHRRRRSRGAGSPPPA